MTREERIDWLCRLRADLNNGVIFTPWNEEFTEALTGILDQEHCEDAISLKAVIEWLKTKDIIKLFSQEETARRELKALSSIRPQEPKAKKVIKMRDATPEERELIGKYIKSISKPVGVDLWDLEQEPILDKIKEEIKDNTYFINETTEKEGVDFETVEKIINKYMAESEG